MTDQRIIQACARSLLQLATGKSEADFGRLVRKAWGEVGRDILDEVERERLLLNAYVVDSAMSQIQDLPNKEEIRALFHQGLREFVTEDFYFEHVTAYGNAEKVPHHNGPAWQIGKVYAGFRGATGDPLQVLEGYTQYMSAWEAVSDFLVQARALLAE